jgi:hypothetical protein
VTITEPVETVDHAVDPIHRVLSAIIDRIPWHSEQQRSDVLDELRSSEVAMKGDDIERSPAVVAPPTHSVGIVNPLDAALAAAGPQPAAIDYQKLAEAIVAAQSKAATAPAPPEPASGAAVSSEGGASSDDSTSS